MFLTAALFLGPLVMASVNDVRIKLIMMPHYWAQSMRVSKGDVSKLLILDITMLSPCFRI